MASPWPNPPPHPPLPSHTPRPVVSVIATPRLPRAELAGRNESGQCLRRPPKLTVQARGIPAPMGAGNIFTLRRLQTPPPFHAIDRAPRRVWGTCAQQLRPPEFREPMALEACGIEKQGGFPFRPWRRNRALLKVWPPRLSDATPRLVHFGPRPYLRAEISNAPGPTWPGPQAEK